MPVLHRHSLDGVNVDTPSSPPTSLGFSRLPPPAAAGASGSSGAAADGTGGGGRPSGWKVVVGLAALGIVICYADRSNMSTAIIPMSQDLGWDKAYQGVVLSAFFLGYATTQILGGAAFWVAVGWRRRGD
jgi:hypothetical protein